MSLFDSLSSAAASALSGSFGGDQTALLQHATQVLQGQPGGLQGLVDSFHAAGLSEQVSSWLGSGSNLPITAEQLQGVLGSGPVAALAEKLGISPGEAATHLASVLPGLLDHASPDGNLDAAHLLDEGLGALKSRLFG